jgi:peroxiredoxin Q/BCP
MTEKGKKAPDFCLPDQDGEKTCLKDFKGQWVVLYFYPKDNTSGCTTEAVDFTGAAARFKKMDAVVLGVSPDSTESHTRFRAKHKLKVTLLSDPEHQALKAFGVWQKKKMYGREFWGVVRSTFLIDPEGRICRAWPKVKVKGHVEEVLDELKEARKNR